MQWRNGNKGISTQLRKPRTFKTITKFFTNRFNTYNAIIKNVIEPMSNRIEEYKETQKQNGEYIEFNLEEIEKKIKTKQNDVFSDQKYESIFKKLGIIDEKNIDKL